MHMTSTSATRLVRVARHLRLKLADLADGGGERDEQREAAAADELRDVAEEAELPVRDGRSDRGASQQRHEVRRHHLRAHTALP
jgi:hypothetical protein